MGDAAILRQMDSADLERKRLGVQNVDGRGGILVWGRRYERVLCQGPVLPIWTQALHFVLKK